MVGGARWARPKRGTEEDTRGIEERGGGEGEESVNGSARTHEYDIYCFGVLRVSLVFLGIASLVPSPSLAASCLGCCMLYTCMYYLHW